MVRKALARYRSLPRNAHCAHATIDGLGNVFISRPIFIQRLQLAERDSQMNTPKFISSNRMKLSTHNTDSIRQIGVRGEAEAEAEFDMLHSPYADEEDWNVNELWKKKALIVRRRDPTFPSELSELGQRIYFYR